MCDLASKARPVLTFELGDDIPSGTLCLVAVVDRRLEGMQMMEMHRWLW